SFSAQQILNVCEDPRLREQEWGNFMDPSIREQELIERNEVGHFFYRFRNGESGADVYDRCTLFLDTLFRKLNTGYFLSDNILIVSHGLFMSLFCMRYFRLTAEKHRRLKDFDNCEYCILERNRKTGSYELKTQIIE
ncbi:unnamed protein product, partial [Didymodactylos carnosus]